MTVIYTEKNLSEAIRATRKKAGLSQIELAELAGVGKTLVFNLEKGNTKVQFDNLLRILRVLNIKLSFGTPYEKS